MQAALYFADKVRAGFDAADDGDVVGFKGVSVEKDRHAVFGLALFCTVSMLALIGAPDVFLRIAVWQPLWLRAEPRRCLPVAAHGRDSKGSESQAL